MIITDKAQIKITELRESNNLRLSGSDELECYELIESDLKLPADATFTRSSVAYLSDGTQVPANLPRFEQGRFGKAIMVEEGTTNLWENINGRPKTMTPSGTTPPAVELVSMQTPFGNEAWKITIPAGNATGYAGCRAVTDNGPVVGDGRKYSYFTYVYFPDGDSNGIYIYPTGYFGMAKCIRNPQKDIGNWLYYGNTGSYTFSPPDTGYDYMTYYASKVFSAPKIFYVAIVQLEEKPYSTSFINGTRAAETLTIPTAGVLNPQEGTIECWVYIDKELWSAFPAIDTRYPIWNIGHGNVYGTYSLYYHPMSNNIRFRIVGDSTNTIDASVGSLDTGCHNIVCGWSQQRMYLAIDGTLIGEIVNPDLADNFYKDGIDIGHYNGSNQINTLIDDLRISNRARSDEEILAAYQSGKPLPVDEWTTYKLDFDDKVRITTQGQIICNELIEI